MELDSQAEDVRHTSSYQVFYLLDYAQALNPRAEEGTVYVRRLEILTTFECACFISPTIAMISSPLNLGITEPGDWMVSFVPP
jgi:hypothetical protein